MPFYASFEDRIIAFYGIGVNMTANVLLLAVIHAFVARKLGADFEILASFVSHQGGFASDVGANNGRDLRNGSAVDMETTGRPATLYEGQNCILMAPPGAALGLAFLSTDKGFVGLHNFASAAHGLDADNPHSFTQAVRHEPSSFQGDAQSPVKLIAADAFLAGAQQVYGLDPKPHRDVAGFENGPDLHGELFAALIALVKADAGRIASHLSNALSAATMGADRAIRPHMRFNPSVSGDFVVKGGGFDDGFGHFGRFPFENQTGI
jgi:hypothetical protein